MSSASSSAASSWSLRRRLLIRLLVMVGMLWMATATLALLSAYSSTTEDLDDSLRRAASLLMGFTEHEYAETAGSSLAGVSASDELPHAGFLYQIWSRQGQLLLRSEGAPLTAIGGALCNDARLIDEGLTLHKGDEVIIVSLNSEKMIYSVKSTNNTP